MSVTSTETRGVEREKRLEYYMRGMEEERDRRRGGGSKEREEPESIFIL